jgi:hypothetical protein
MRTSEAIRKKLGELTGTVKEVMGRLDLEPLVLPPH